MIKKILSNTNNTGKIKLQILKTALDFIQRNYSNYDFTEAFGILGVSSFDEVDISKMLNAKDYHVLMEAIYQPISSKISEVDLWFQSSREFYITGVDDKTIYHLIKYFDIDSLYRLFPKLAGLYNENFKYKSNKISKSVWVFSISLNPKVTNPDFIKLNTDSIEIVAHSTLGYVLGIADLKRLKNIKNSEVEVADNKKSAKFTIETPNFTSSKLSTKEAAAFILLLVPSIILVSSGSYYFGIISLILMFVLYWLHHKQKKDLYALANESIEKSLKIGGNELELSNYKIKNDKLKLITSVFEELKEARFDEDFFIKLSNKIKADVELQKVEFLTPKLLNFGHYLDLILSKRVSEGVKFNDHQLNKSALSYIFKVNSELIIYISHYTSLSEDVINQISVISKVINLMIAQEKSDELKAKYNMEEKLFRLTRSISHDLRAPLNALAVIKEKANINDNHSKILHLAIDRISKMANEILSYKKSAENKPKLQKFDLIQAIKELESEYKYMSVGKKLSVIYQCDTANISAVKSDFMRIISNLVNNANEATCDERGKITIQIKKNKNYIQVKIVDNGIGLSQEQLMELNKNKELKTKKNNGYGIGLSNVISLILKNNGFVFFGNTEDKSLLVLLAFKKESISNLLPRGIVFE